MFVGERELSQNLKKQKYIFCKTKDKAATSDSYDLYPDTYFSTKQIVHQMRLFLSCL